MIWKAFSTDYSTRKIYNPTWPSGSKKIMSSWVSENSMDIYVHLLTSISLLVWLNVLSLKKTHMNKLPKMLTWSLNMGLCSVPKIYIIKTLKSMEIKLRLLILKKYTGFFNTLQEWKSRILLMISWIILSKTLPQAQKLNNYAPNRTRNALFISTNNPMTRRSLNISNLKREILLMSIKYTRSTCLVISTFMRKSLNSVIPMEASSHIIQK